jgi:hypothetical protein
MAPSLLEAKLLAVSKSLAAMLIRYVAPADCIRVSSQQQSVIQQYNTMKPKERKKVLQNGRRRLFYLTTTPAITVSAAMLIDTASTCRRINFRQHPVDHDAYPDYTLPDKV